MIGNLLALIGLASLIAAAWWGGYTSGLRRGAETYRATREELVEAQQKAADERRSDRGIKLASLKISR